MVSATPKSLNMLQSSADQQLAITIIKETLPNLLQLVSHVSVFYWQRFGTKLNENN